MKHGITPSARHRLNETAREQANQFDSTLLSNYIHDHLPEDDRLRQFVDLAERAYDLASDASRDTYDSTALAGAEELNDGAEERVDEVVAELVADLNDETLDEWCDVWDDDEIEAARRERDQFLDQSNSHAAALAQQLREAEDGDVDV